MSANDTWMPLYIGDYLADTMHLTNTEHGAYLLLIMHYWRSGPLPDDDKALAAIARTDRSDWPEIAKTLRAFFRSSGGKLRHKRIDQELTTAHVNIEQRRAAGKASAEARARQRAANGHGNEGGNGPPNENPTTVPTSVPTEGSTGGQRNGRPSPSPSPSPLPSPSPTPEGKSLAIQAIAEFDQFWLAYPRKIGKGQARSAWPRAIAKTTIDAILLALLEQGLDPNSKFTPHPATWLNGERWLDEEVDQDQALLRAMGVDDELGSIH